MCSATPEREDPPILPLVASRFVIVHDLGVAYRGPLADKYWRHNRQRERTFPFTVGYLATKETRFGTLFTQTIREGPDGPVFSVKLNDEEATGHSPETAWTAASAFSGFSANSGRKYGREYFGYDSEAVVAALANLVPVYSEKEQESTLDQPINPEPKSVSVSDPPYDLEASTTSIQQTSPVESSVSDVDASPSHSFLDLGATMAVKTGSSEGSASSHDLLPAMDFGKQEEGDSTVNGVNLKDLLRLRTQKLQDAGNQLLPVSWALYDRILQPPDLVDIRTVMGVTPARRNDNGAWKDATASVAQPVKRRAETAAITVKEEAEQEAEQETVETEDDVEETETESEAEAEAESESDSEKEEEDESPPEKLRLKDNHVAETAPGLSSRTVTSSKIQPTAETKLESRENKNPLTRAPPLTPVSLSRNRDGSMLAILLAVVAGGSNSLLALLCEDNVFRLVPESDVSRLLNDAKVELSIRSKISYVLSPSKNNNGQRKATNPTDLLPSKQSWKAAPKGRRGFEAEGDGASLEIVDAFKKLVKINSVGRMQ